MFKFPNAKPHAVASISQRCVGCGQWFKLPQGMVREAHQRWVDRQDPKAGAQFKPAASVKCAWCRKENLLIPIGKYDRPGIPQHRCSVQWVEFAGAAGVKKPPVKKADPKVAEVIPAWIIGVITSKFTKLEATTLVQDWKYYPFDGKTEFDVVNHGRMVLRALRHHRAREFVEFLRRNKVHGVEFVPENSNEQLVFSARLHVGRELGEALWGVYRDLGVLKKAVKIENGFRLDLLISESSCIKIDGGVKGEPGCSFSVWP